MVEAKSEYDNLYERMRIHFNSDTECLNGVNHVIQNKLTVWQVPSLHTAHSMDKNTLLNVLYYCPESQYFHASDQIMEQMAQTESWSQILSKVKALYKRKLE